jgi:hypothetical protein
MANVQNKLPIEYFEVIHPLQDAGETKRSAEGLGHIRMSKSVRFCLTTLRIYLIAMSVLLLYHVLGLAGVTLMK